MRLFSNRDRPAAWGPLPSERLPRLDGSAPPTGPGDLDSTPTGPTSPVAGPRSFLPAAEAVVEVFTAHRTAPVAPTPAPLPSPAAAADNVRGYCYFLDADLVGIGATSPAIWSADPIAGQVTTIVIAVGHGRTIEPDEPGYGWISGGQTNVADLRATEIATVVARYLGTLGHTATAHTPSASDVDRAAAAIEAGVAERRRGRLGNPLLPSGFSLAVITTDLALDPDGPLAPRGRVRNLSVLAAHAIGLGGTRPRWARLTGRHRPWHLGRYPMEKVRRVDRPTTLIIDDEVERVPARHNFFVRAGAGDLGPRPQEQVGRFIRKAPHGLASQDLLRALVPLQHGPAADDRDPDSHDPAGNADRVKALGHVLGADMTGVCRAPAHAWYSHRPDGTPIEPAHENAIVFVLDQGHETMEGASGDDWISGAQSMRAYLRASVIACTLARHLRSLGWEAQAHTAAHDEINHIPLLLEAGIGELSRIGELVLNPFVGPRFKSGVVTTNFPMTPDRPIDFGLQDFCTHCTKCARECPAGAIRFGAKTMFNGYEMWKPDVDRCGRYRITNMRGSACGRCMKTCPYNVEGVLAERPFQWAAMRLPFTRPWIARLDDRVGRGVINPVKKWWIDIEMIDGVPVSPPKGANARGLALKRRPRDESGYAMFPPSLAPPGPDGMAPFPLDRAAGVAAAAQAESPEQARRRTGRSSPDPGRPAQNATPPQEQA